MGATLHIQLLGDFRITCDDAPLTTVNTERLQSLLAYLVLHRGAPQSRQAIAFFFWPDSTEKQALSNLRTLLYHLRQALPEPDRFLEVDARMLTWKAEAPFTLDVAGFEQALSEAEEAIQRAEVTEAQAALDRAVGLYRGELLAGLYEDWIFPERERLHQQCTRALERLIHLLETGRDYAGALRHAQRLLQLDPLREPTYRLLMRLHALDGDRAGAARAYQQCVTALQRELDMEPEQSTKALYERLISDGDLTPDGNLPEEQPSFSDTDEVPLVGRRREWNRLRDAWHEAAEGQAHLVTICGEAGIGKTRLAEELFTWASRQGVATARARSYAAEARLAYAPVTEWLRSEALWPGLAHLDEVWLSEVARLLPELRIEHPKLPEPEPLVESWQRRRLFEALARAVLATGQPLLLLLDDVQWCDQDTLEWLRFLLRFAPEARLIIVGTVRSEKVDAGHALQPLLLDLGRTGKLVEVELEPLNEDDTARLAAHVAGRALREEQTRLLYEETEGNPLFVVETVRAGLSPAEPAKRTTRRNRVLPAPAETSLPPTVQRVITTRLAQLSPPARAIVGLAAAVGRSFSFEMLLRAGYTDEERLAEALDELWQRRIVREQEPDVYDFTHDKLRDVAYAEITPARRRLLHRRIAQALEELHAADRDAVSAPIAAHYEQGGLFEQAISYYERAAMVARRVYADEEVVRLLRRALVLLERMPEGRARDERELQLLMVLGPALEATRGWAHADVGATYERAYELCRHLEAGERLFGALWGVYTVRLVRAELQPLREITTRLLRMAEEQRSTPYLLAARLGAFFNAFFLGELTSAYQHLEKAFALPDFDRVSTPISLLGADERVFCHCCAAHVLWFLGYPERALRHADEALELAEASSNPFNRAIAHCYLAMLHQYRRAADAVEEHVKAGAMLCRQHGFSYYAAWCVLMEGWTRTAQGALDVGIEQMQRGLAELRNTGAVLREPYYLALLAEACANAQRPDEALALLDEAQEAVHRQDEHWIQPELHRLRGELLLAQNGEEEAAADCFLQAQSVAEAQQARSLELRAALSLGRLWYEQGKKAEAKRHLQHIYASFTEGHDTADLKEAAELLAAWG